MERSIELFSFMPDFYTFWEQAQFSPLREKIKLWDELFEIKHKEFYRQVIYEGTSGDKLETMKQAKLASFFSTLSEADVKRMQTQESKIKCLIPEAVNDVFNTVRVDAIPTCHYLVPSLHTSSGAVRPFNQKLVAYYGLELLSRFDRSLDIKANIFHESFHHLHFQNLFPALMEKYEGTMNLLTFVRGEGPLFFAFTEGLAVYVTELAYPEAFRPGLIEENVPLYQEHFHEYTQGLLKDGKEFDYEDYEKYFLDSSKNPSVPEKFGYWLGYQVVKSLRKEFSISEMMALPPKEIDPIVAAEIRSLLK